MNHDCHCPAPTHTPRLIAMTGGPGAGKTAVLEVVKRHFCEHVAVVPEAASIVFGGGFPRDATDVIRRAAQRAIYSVQRELERIVIEQKRAAVALCDRGSLDGLAYWPGDDESFFAGLATTRTAELARYAAVIHLRTPAAEQGYDRSNPLRVEPAREAAAVDERILRVWRDHPKRHVVESTMDFLDKLARVIELIRAEVPPCCKHHVVPEVAGRAATAARRGGGAP